MMNKDADNIFQRSNAAELGGMSAALGAGGYSAFKLMREFGNTVNPPKKDKGVLTIDVPKPHSDIEEKKAFFGIPLSDSSENEVSKNFGKALAVGAGGVSGFMGASSLYNHFKQQSEKQDLEKEKRKYIDTIKASQKTASETPLFDEFCKGIHAQLKEDMSKGATDWSANAPIPGVPQIAGAAKGLVSHTYDALNEGTGGIPNAALAFLALATLGAGGATYAGARMIDAKKEHPDIPRQVKLKYV